MRLRALLAVAAICATAGGAPATGSAAPPGREVWGFMPDYDPSALGSLEAHGGQVGVALPTGLVLTSGRALVQDRLPRAAVRAAKRLGVRLEPVLANVDAGGWNPALAERVLRSPALSARLVETLARRARAAGYDGINVDLEQLPAAARRPLVGFVRALGRALGPGREVSVDVPATPDPAYDLRGLGRAAGHVVLMTYDQHASPGAPGPVAGSRWVAGVAGSALRLVPGDRLVVALPTYGYAWSGARAPRPLDHAAAQALAARAAVTPTWSDHEGASWFSSGRGAEREVVWLSDARSLAGQLRVLPAGQAIGLWHLGGEDPAIWPLLAGAKEG